MNKGCFKKGDIPWNKDTKGIMKPNKTSYKKGQTAGDKSNKWKGGVQINKNDSVYLYAGVNKRIRRPKSVWEEVWGEIPKGMIIYHIDGNHHNDDIDNLEVITRAELLKRNRIK